MVPIYLNPTWYIFTASTTVGFMWVYGFVTEPFLKDELPIKVLLMLAALSTLIISYVIKKWKSSIFTTKEDSLKSLGKHYLIAIVATYFSLIPIVSAVVVSLLFSAGKVGDKEALQYLVLISIWFPMWLCVPVGLCLGWWKYYK